MAVELATALLHLSNNHLFGLHPAPECPPHTQA